MAYSGVTENEGNACKVLKGLVGAWGFEPQTPSVSKHHSTHPLIRKGFGTTNLN